MYVIHMHPLFLFVRRLQRVPPRPSSSSRFWAPRSILSMLVILLLLMPMFDADIWFRGCSFNPFSNSPFPPEVVSNAAYGAGVLAIHAPAAVFSRHLIYILFLCNIQ